MENDLNLEDTELRLGLPGTETDADALPCTTAARGSKRACPDTDDDAGVDDESSFAGSGPCGSRSSAPPATKAQVVGWPPIRSYRRNNFHHQAGNKDEIQETGMGMYVKVSMDGAPYLRKIDIKGYKGYPDLLKALESMFKFTIGEYSEREGYKGSEYVPTYEDKDGDWMLVGDVPWEMFISSCKKLRIMKGSEAKGLSCNI